ncbi:MAG: FeoB-associated Cys-rich membrane protein [Ruminococcus sp.]|nr:FeoB-associated Cys-rich membrane protein [Ruminococcus sp.]
MVCRIRHQTHLQCSWSDMMNIFDIILLILIGLALFMAIRKVISDHKKGGCCGNCSGCSQSGHCNRK